MLSGGYRKVTFVWNKLSVLATGLNKQPVGIPAETPVETPNVSRTESPVTIGSTLKKSNYGDHLCTKKLLYFEFFYNFLCDDIFSFLNFLDITFQ